MHAKLLEEIKLVGYFAISYDFNNPIKAKIFIAKFAA